MAETMVQKEKRADFPVEGPLVGGVEIEGLAQLRKATEKGKVSPALLEKVANQFLKCEAEAKEPRLR